MPPRDIAKRIKTLREQQKISQEFVAKKLGLSRPTYIQIESGRRDPTLSELEVLASLLNTSLSALLDQKQEHKFLVHFEKATKQQPQKTDLRISVPQKNVQKFKEVLLYILTKIGGRPHVGETVLYKLLYFVDFDFYEKFEEQLIGATYIKNHYGPTPVEFKAIVDGMMEREEITTLQGKYFNHMQRKYLALREPDLTELNARELHHIDEVLARLGEKNAKEFTEYSHSDVPWIITGDNKPINYEGVFYRTPKTSVRNYGDEDSLQ